MPSSKRAQLYDGTDFCLLSTTGGAAAGGPDELLTLQAATDSYPDELPPLGSEPGPHLARQEQARKELRTPVLTGFSQAQALHS